MRKMIIVALGIALYAGAALARPPGPESIGEFYVYFNAAGQVVGEASIDCQGSLHQSGVRTNSYSIGYAICLPAND